MISATQIYDFVQCPQRVTLDVHGNTLERDEPNAFVQLLWEQGINHEEKIVASLTQITNLREGTPKDRECETLEAIKRGDALIYGGRLIINDLVGEPDLLERRGEYYVPGDIKSGTGLEGDEDESKLKRHYAYQLAHYVYILEKLGLSDGHREAFVIDRNANRVAYPLMTSQGVKNKELWWDAYLSALSDVRNIVASSTQTKPALSATCKLCHWYTHCKNEMISSDDLTLIAELGRSKRDVMIHEIPSVKALAKANPESFFDKKKTIFPGVGPDSLRKFHARAKLLSTADSPPYLKAKVILPQAKKEVFFDIEADPMRDVVYLHGFVERAHNQPKTAKFISYFAEGVESEQEERAFGSAWEYLSARIDDSVIYYYSKYERTAYRKLSEKFPIVCSREKVDALFALPVMIDLYEIVRTATEWPTYDQSIKTLAQYSGFQWRDPHPSGAASIEWFHRYTEQKDPAIKIRILEYNEDDCLATGIVIDKIRALK